jgi:hypothetical protein
MFHRNKKRQPEQAPCRVPADGELRPVVDPVILWSHGSPGKQRISINEQALEAGDQPEAPRLNLFGDE